MDTLSLPAILVMFVIAIGVGFLLGSTVLQHVKGHSEARQRKGLSEAKASLNRWSDNGVIEAFTNLAPLERTAEITIQALKATASYELYERIPIDVVRNERSLREDASGYAAGYSWDSDNYHDPLPRDTQALYTTYRGRISNRETKEKLGSAIPETLWSNPEIIRHYLIVVSIQPDIVPLPGEHQVVDQYAEYQEWISDGSYGGPRGAVNYEQVTPGRTHMEKNYRITARYEYSGQAAARWKALPRSLRDEVLRGLPGDLRALIESQNVVSDE